MSAVTLLIICDFSNIQKTFFKESTITLPRVMIVSCHVAHVAVFKFFEKKILKKKIKKKKNFMAWHVSCTDTMLIPT